MIQVETKRLTCWSLIFTNKSSLNSNEMGTNHKILKPISSGIEKVCTLFVLVKNAWPLKSKRLQMK